MLLFFIDDTFLATKYLHRDSTAQILGLNYKIVIVKFIFLTHFNLLPL